MIYIVDENFQLNTVNPFTDTEFDDSWIVLHLTDSNAYDMMCGSENSVYTLKISKNYADWKMAVCDFIGFHNTNNDNTIICIDKTDLKNAQLYYGNHSFNDNFLREYEPDILVHSTTYDNWLKIKSDGCLKSWNVLQSENRFFDRQPIGALLGDPAAFSNYIMFSNGAVAGEIVVLSKQNNKIIMDENMIYNPGARLYFDMKKIAEDGLLIRDGEHFKVKNILPLTPYLLWSATYETIGLNKNISTPKEFTYNCNSMFNNLFNKNLK